MVGQLNSLEKFATEQFSKLKERNKNLQELLNERMISDLAVVKAELSVLKSRIADPVVVSNEIKLIRYCTSVKYRYLKKCT